MYVRRKKIKMTTMKEKNEKQDYTLKAFDRKTLRSLPQFQYNTYAYTGCNKISITNTFLF